MNGAGSVSVVMPFHNDARWFPAALTSVLEQTLPPVEVLVVDDASSGDAQHVLEGLPAPVRVLRTDRNRGPGHARQLGTQAAVGEYISYLDSDDFWPREFLETVRNGLRDAPESVAAYTGITKLYPDGTERVFGVKPARLGVREAIIRFHAYPALGMIFHLGSLRAIGGWDGSRHFVEDWDLVVRLLDRCGPIPLVPGVYPTYRIGHQPGRRNAAIFGKLRRWWWTVRRNRALLCRHYGRRAHLNRMAQAVADRADRVGGIGGLTLRASIWLLGTPLVQLYPDPQ